MFSWILWVQTMVVLRELDTALEAGPRSFLWKLLSGEWRQNGLTSAWKSTRILGTWSTRSSVRSVAWLGHGVPTSRRRHGLRSSLRLVLIHMNEGREITLDSAISAFYNF